MDYMMKMLNLGLEPGTVVVTEEAVDSTLRPELDLVNHYNI